jgi:hypothetical protein
MRVSYVRTGSQQQMKATAAEIDEAISYEEPESTIIYSPPEKARQYLAGPLDWLDICLAARRGKAALCLWLLLHHRSRMRKESWITLPNQQVADMGVSRDAKYRALAALEREGLVWVAPRAKGKPLLVALARERKRKRDGI